MCSHGAAERPSLSDGSCVLVRRRIEAKVRGTLRKLPRGRG